MRIVLVHDAQLALDARAERVERAGAGRRTVLLELDRERPVRRRRVPGHGHEVGRSQIQRGQRGAHRRHDVVLHELLADDVERRSRPTDEVNARGRVVAPRALEQVAGVVAGEAAARRDEQSVPLSNLEVLGADANPVTALPRPSSMYSNTWLVSATGPPGGVLSEGAVPPPLVRGVDGVAEGESDRASS